MLLNNNNKKILNRGLFSTFFGSIKHIVLNWTFQRTVRSPLLFFPSHKAKMSVWKIKGWKFLLCFIFFCLRKPKIIWSLKFQIRKNIYCNRMPKTIFAIYLGFFTQFVYSITTVTPVVFCHNPISYKKNMLLFVK